MKKIVRLLVLMVLMVLTIPAAHAATYNGSCGTGINWTLDTDTGVLNIRGNGDMKDFGLYGSPWYQYRNKITSVVIEPGVTSIGNYSFERCEKLTSVSIPEGVTKIGDYAFYVTFDLAEVKLPESLTTIGNGAFNLSTSIERLEIPAAVTYIGDHAFRNNSSLTEVIFHEGLEYVGSYAFAENKKLVHALLPDSVTYIGASAFVSCGKLVAANISDHINTIYDNTFAWCTSLYSLEIGENVETIEMYAFQHCESLEYTKLPDGLKTIAKGAFQYAGLKQIVLPDTTSYVGSFAFRGCDDLQKIAILNPDCLLEDRSDLNYENLGVVGVATIYCHESYSADKNCYTAFEFANAHNYAYELINGENIWTDTFVPPPSQEVEEEPQENPFTDVSDTTLYYYAPVLWAYHNGITTGMSPDTFGPNGNCQRGQVVTFLWRAIGSPEPTSTYCPFVDVQSHQYYYKAVMWAYENGITTGMDATHFAPNAQVTRGQFVTFLWRTMDQPAATGRNVFADVSADQYYYDAVLWAYENGITTGISSNTFGPDHTCTRAQVVTFLHRCLVD